MLFLHSDAASLEGEEPSISDQSSQGCIGEKPRVSTGMKPGYLDSVRCSRPGAIFGLNRAVVLLFLHVLVTSVAIVSILKLKMETGVCKY